MFLIQIFKFMGEKLNNAETLVDLCKCTQKCLEAASLLFETLHPTFWHRGAALLGAVCPSLNFHVAVVLVIGAAAVTQQFSPGLEVYDVVVKISAFVIIPAICMSQQEVDAKTKLAVIAGVILAFLYSTEALRARAQSRRWLEMIMALVGAIIAILKICDHPEHYERTWMFVMSTILCFFKSWDVKFFGLLGFMLAIEIAVSFRD